MLLVRILWVIVLTCFSLAPWIVKFRLGMNGPRHNLWHVAAFFITAFIFSIPAPFDPQSLQGNGAGRNSMRAAWQMFPLLTAPLVAISLEALEVAVYHNAFEWHDVAVDGAGIAAGLAAWQMFATLSHS